MAARDKKPNRLLTRKEFLAARNRGRSVAVGGIVLQARDRKDDGPVRFGLTCTKKIGNSPIRSRARRRMRALGEQVLMVDAKPAADYVLIARHSTLTRPWSRLTQDLKTALQKLGFLAQSTEGQGDD
ncbi:MAG: ribonuclease P protein component [Alphaproteobacteria bacterium]